MIEAAKARYCKHSQTIKNFNHKRDSVSDFGSCVLVFDYLQRVHTANNILHYVPIFVSDPLLLCVWRVTSYQGDKDLKKRFSDNLRRRTDSIEDFENFTVDCCSVLDNRYKNHFFQDWEKRGCSACNIALLTTLIILKLCKFGDNPLNLQAFKNPW